MPIAAVAIAAVGLGVSVYQTVDAKKKQKEAQKEMDEYERQKITNPYENLQVSTLGAELQQQNLNTQVSTAVDALRAGGSRAIMGGLPTLYDNILKSNQQIAAGLDMQENQNQQLEAQGNAMVQNMNEQRERDDLLGIGNAINTYRNEYNQGLTSIVQSAASLGSAVSSMGSTSGAGQRQASSTSQNTVGNGVSANLYNNSSATGINPYQDQITQFNQYQRTLYGRR